MSSLYGHDAFLKEGAALRSVFERALAASEERSMSGACSSTTRAVRAALESDSQYGAVIPPIHLTSTFAFKAFGEKRCYDYTRSGNPTRDALGETLAALEGGAGRRRDRIWHGGGKSGVQLAQRRMTCSSRRMTVTAERIDCSAASRGAARLRVEFVDQTDERALTAALARRPKLVWVETPSNPLLRIVDIRAAAAPGSRGRRAAAGRQHFPFTRVAATHLRWAPIWSCIRRPST